MRDALGQLLKRSQESRGISLLDLALRLDMSQRHVSFVGSGRACPSRGLVLGWMREVAAPLSLRNAGLLQAGYPAYGETRLDNEQFPLREGEEPVTWWIRFRTLGCYPLTGAIESSAATLAEIIQEMLLATTSERQGRVIDQDNASSMEKKKQEGYF